jgi:hypothetical protein
MVDVPMLVLTVAVVMLALPSVDVLGVALAVVVTALAIVLAMLVPAAVLVHCCSLGYRRPVRRA